MVLIAAASEVDELEPCFVSLFEHDVFGLDITVNNFVVVQEG